MPSDEKASAFLEAINKYAEQQRNEIHAEVEQFKEEELKKAEIEVLTDAYTLIQKEMAQMRKEAPRKFPTRKWKAKESCFCSAGRLPRRYLKEPRKSFWLIPRRIPIPPCWRDMPPPSPKR